MREETASKKTLNQNKVGAMSRTYKDLDEARLDLLEKSKQWRASFTALQSSKTAGVKEIATTVSGVAETLTACQSMILTKQKEMGTTVEHLSTGVDIATKTVEIMNTQMTEEKQLTRTLEKNLDATMKTSKEAERRGKTNLTTIQRIQLERAQSSIIVRNLKADTRNETYDDMERAFEKVTRALDLKDIRINYIRRLPRPRGDPSTEPLALKVELGCLGDKIKLFVAMEAMAKRKIHLPYQISNEIPNYAMNQYKYLSRVAAEVRRSYPGIKTRTGILRGDIEPSITIRGRDETTYRKIPGDMLEAAKTEVNRRNKIEADRRRKEREERTLLGSQPMDTGAPTAGNY